MEASELRIGNWVYDTYYEEITVVKSINRKHTENLHPIHLTEERLLKLGFDESRINGLPIITFTKKAIEVWFKNGKIISVYVGQQRVDDGSKINQVHLIQNLYYFVHLEELETKEV